MLACIVGMLRAQNLPFGRQIDPQATRFNAHGRGIVRTPLFRIAASLVTALAALGGASAAPISFEPAEGFTAGEDIATQADWKKSTSGAAIISTDEARSGSQSLKIAASSVEAAATLNFPISGDGIVFLDFAILPTADDSAAPLSTVDANGAVLGFLKSQDQGAVVAVSAPATKNGPSNSLDTGYTFPLDEENVATDWIHVTIRENLKGKKWDLYLDGVLTLIDQPLTGKMDGKTGALSLYASPIGPAYADDLTISGDNPLFPDADKDGIPDAEEEVAGTDPKKNDRSAVVSGGLSSIENFANRARKGYSNTSSDTRSEGVVYVDNHNGNDQNSGEFSYHVLGRGPKASMAGAAQGRRTMFKVILLPSDQPYFCPDYPKGQAPDVTITALGNASLTTETQ
jgi:hypothetical protein